MDKMRRELLSLNEYESIRPAIGDFERIVWFGGDISLSDVVRGNTCRGLKGTCGDLTVAVWTCAGRTMLTFRNFVGDWLSLMVAEDSVKPTMGLHERSIDSGDIAAWLLHASENWAGVEPDENVTLDVLRQTVPSC